MLFLAQSLAIRWKGKKKYPKGVIASFTDVHLVAVVSVGLPLIVYLYYRIGVITVCATVGKTMGTSLL